MTEKKETEATEVTPKRVEITIFRDFTTGEWGVDFKGPLTGKDLKWLMNKVPKQYYAYKRKLARTLTKEGKSYDNQKEIIKEPYKPNQAKKSPMPVAEMSFPTVSVQATTPKEKPAPEEIKSVKSSEAYKVPSQSSAKANSSNPKK